MTPSALTPSPPCARERAIGCSRAASSSSGQRGRAGASQPSVRPSASRSAPGERDHGGVVGAVGERRGGEGEAVLDSPSASSRTRTAVFAATPPATTNSRPSSPALADVASHGACAPLGELVGDGVLHGERQVGAFRLGLDRFRQAGRRRSSARRRRSRSPPGRAACAAGRSAPARPAPGQRLQRRAAGIGQAQAGGDLVEGFARGVVDGRPQPARLARSRPPPAAGNGRRRPVAGGRDRAPAPPAGPRRRAPPGGSQRSAEVLAPGRWPCRPTGPP